MFDPEAYLHRIGVPVPANPDLPTLRALQHRHLSAIPYNIAPADFADGVHLVHLDEDEIFARNVLAGRGGTCFQLNRLFHRLLGELGYDVSLVAGSTAEGRAHFGTDVEHMFCLVVLDGEQWITDVGYPGPSYTEPLRVAMSAQEQHGSQFRVRELDGALAVQRRGRVTRWGVVYTFTPQPRRYQDWAEFEKRAREQQPTEAAADFQGVLRGRTFADGQAVLKGRRYLVVQNGREHVHTITDDDEHRRLSAEILAGEFDRPPVPR
ncbi:arylamine N-acetyltransferase family protein [Frankia sp. AgKG'84/4]|uniref:arylamine N-acetyltransferase family protein n=1 Tax=Frankia sp. AgKG'84/4 TaxID=573490 RepID=UPI00200C9DE2|nr:arylamine N-acetyltransferase [Frankia sp. AgKG'84/4]MCL9794451.1 arylamine N-acetyltransferase [Frankia sp. AgKG'84/4]